MSPHGEYLIGLDLLDVTRVPPARPLADRILGPEEVRFTRDGSGPFAALAIKEAVIKAVGGRPPGFRWQDAVLLAEIPASSCPPPLCRLKTVISSPPHRASYVDCRIRHGLRTWARRRLSLSPDVGVRCSGMWLQPGPGELIAAVVIGRDDGLMTTNREVTG